MDSLDSAVVVVDDTVVDTVWWLVVETTEMMVARRCGCVGGRVWRAASSRHCSSILLFFDKSFPDLMNIVLTQPPRVQILNLVIRRNILQGRMRPEPNCLFNFGSLFRVVCLCHVLLLLCSNITFFHVDIVIFVYKLYWMNESVVL